MAWNQAVFCLPFRPILASQQVIEDPYVVSLGVDVIQSRSTFTAGFAPTACWGLRPDLKRNLAPLFPECNIARENLYLRIHAGGSKSDQRRDIRGPAQRLRASPALIGTSLSGEKDTSPNLSPTSGEDLRQTGADMVGEWDTSLKLSPASGEDRNETNGVYAHETLT